MKKAVFAVIYFVLVFSFVGQSNAVTDGELDGLGHPYVGLMVAKDADGTPLWRCSGTLISETVFLTAGHCTESPAASATIWFESDIQSNQAALGYPDSGATSVDGLVYTHPQFESNTFYLHDLGVVVLNEPVAMQTYGALPQLKVLDAYKKGKDRKDLYFTSVGYGLQKSFPDAASFKEQAFKIRMVAYPKLIQIGVPGSGGDYSLLLSNNANTGGTCFGDSGGPNFIESTNIIAGVTSFGKNGTCAGTGGVYRIDQTDDLDWLNSFGVTP